MEIQDVYRSMQRHKELFDTKNHPWVGGSDTWLDPLLLGSLKKYQGRMSFPKGIMVFCYFLI